MGCDIHLYKEKQVNGEWLTADSWGAYDYGDDEKGMEVPWEQRFTDRNYDLFGLLAKDVRRDHPFSFATRGIPFNACAEVAEESVKWDSDGHSHSYLYLHELKDMLTFLGKSTMKISGMKDKSELAALQFSIASGAPNWNLLYPYCQATNAEGYAEFEIDVPAMFSVGESLEKIIADFEGVEGENHRIVFFFDN